MSIKVLLADDSSAIKKVMQLSLQDMGLELKTMSSGQEVLKVAREFKPHIAFVDVLLPQKSGYDIASEIKKDAHLRNTPVVLLWSAFMAFDEGKYVASGADAKLEKPFEAAALRSMVLELVPETKSKGEALPPNLNFEVPIGTVPPAKKEGDWSMSSFQDIGAYASESTKTDFGSPSQEPPPAPFTSASLPEAPKTVPQVPKNSVPNFSTPEPVAAWGTDSEWVKKDLGKFKVPIPQENQEEEAIPFEYTSSQIKDTSFLFKPQDSGTKTLMTVQAENEKEDSNDTQRVPPQIENTQVSNHSLSLEELSDLKLQTREIIEKVVMKLVPELASQMIREELDRLLAEDR